jgi:hypothetical protein
VALKAKPKAPDLLSIPLEMQQKVFMYTTARDTTRLRRVCKSLNEIISCSSKHPAKNLLPESVYAFGTPWRSGRR